MRGHIRRHRNGWQAIVYAGIDADTGKKRYLSKSATSQKAAEDALVDLMVKVRRGEHLVADCTVTEMVERWYTNLGETWSPSRRATVRNHIDSKIRKAVAGQQAAFGDRRARDVRTRDLDLFYGRLRRAGSVKGTSLARSTVESIHHIISAAYEEAIRCEVLTTNPATRAELGPTEYREVNPPDDDEVDRLVAFFEERDHAFFTYVAVSADAGNRRGELHGARWSDFKPAARELWLRTSVVYDENGKLVDRDQTKTSKSRRLTLSKFTADELVRHRRNCIERALAVGVHLEDDAYIFSHDLAGRSPWKPASTSQRFKRARRTIGVDDRVKLKDLRHYVASVLIAAGVDITTVSKRLGHRKTSTTLDIYAHLVAAADHAAADVMDRKRRRSV